MKTEQHRKSRKENRAVRKKYQQGKHLTLILSDSIVSLRNKAFNAEIDTRKEQCIVSKHPGATTDQMEHNMAYWLRTVRPERVIISGGINNIIQRPQQANDPLYIEDTVEEILDLGRMAKEGGVRNVCILGLLNVNYFDESRSQIDTYQFNALLKQRCEVLNFRFIDNSNIPTSKLYDGLHASPSGLNILKENILRCFSTHRY